MKKIAIQRQTSVIDLTRNKEEIWRSFNRNTRNHIKKAEKEDICVEIIPISETKMIFKAKYKGLVISEMTIKKFEDTIYNIETTNNNNYKHLNANSLLLWEVIKFYKDLYFDEFDLMGLDIPSIKKFKQGFGGKEVNFYVLMNKYWYKLKKLKEKITGKKPIYNVVPKELQKILELY